MCRLAILRREVISVEKWEADLRSIQSKLEKAEEQISNWRAKYENLEEEKEKLFKEMLSEIEKDYAREKEKTSELKDENQQLIKYIDRLQNESLGINRGAGIPDLKTKQAKNRKLKELKVAQNSSSTFQDVDFDGS